MATSGMTYCQRMSLRLFVVYIRCTQVCFLRGFISCSSTLIPPSLSGQATQSANMSWWPKLIAWNNSGMQVGFWSPYCEEWFQLHLKSILSGGASPRTSKGWDQALKLARKQSKLACNYEHLAAQFVTDELLRESL